MDSASEILSNSVLMAVVITTALMSIFSFVASHFKKPKLVIIAFIFVAISAVTAYGYKENLSSKKITSISEKITELNNQIDTSISNIKALNDDLSKITVAIDLINTNIRTSTDKLDAINLQAASIGLYIAENKSDLSALQSKITSYTLTVNKGMAKSLAATQNVAAKYDEDKSEQHIKDQRLHSDIDEVVQNIRNNPLNSNGYSYDSYGSMYKSNINSFGCSGIGRFKYMPC